MKERLYVMQDIASIYLDGVGMFQIQFYLRGTKLKPKKKELIKRLRKYLNLSERDASDKDLLECFGHTSLSTMENLPIKSRISSSY